MTESLPDPSRKLYWLGLALVVLGPVLMVVQLALKYLATPWYLPVLTTLGALLLLVALVRRWGVIRLGTLVLVGAFAALQWFFIAGPMKLPEYAGPAQKGQAMPAFTSTLADGKTFTEADLRDGSHRAMVFFRGRW